MIRIAITPAAYAAIAATLVLGTVAVEPERAQDGSVHIWLDPGVVARLKAARGPGESYSDVILRLAAAEIALCGLPTGLAGLLGWGRQAKMRRESGVAWRVCIHWFRRSSQ
jgi:hypothetical protein